MYDNNKIKKILINKTLSNNYYLQSSVRLSKKKTIFSQKKKHFPIVESTVIVLSK